MIETLYNKLESVIKIPAVRENEVLIRNLSQILLYEIKELTQNERYIKEARDITFRCLRHIDRLNNEILFKSDRDDIVSAFRVYRFSSLTESIVESCDILMSRTSIKAEFIYNREFFTVCSKKLILTAIGKLFLLFYNHFEYALIEFSCRKNKSSTVLSAETKEAKLKSNENISGSTEFKILKKIAELHLGSLLHIQKENRLKLILSLKNEDESLFPKENFSSFTELLIDKTSEIYVALSGVKEISE